MTELLGRRALTLASLAVVLTLGLKAYAVDVPDEWKSADAAGLTRLANGLNAEGDAKKGERQLLASYVAKRYLAESSSGQPDWRQWLPLLQIVVADMPDNSKSSVRTGLQQGLVEDEDAVRRLDEPSIVALCEVLLGLGQDSWAASCAKTWADARPSLEDLSISGLVGMAKALGNVREYGEVRLKIAGAVSAKYLTDEPTMWSVSCAQWVDLVTAVGRNMSTNDRETWRSKLRSAYSAKKDMSYSDLGKIQWALQMLGDGHVWLFAAEWVKAHDTWRSWSADDLGKLGLTLGIRNKTTEQGVIEGRRILTQHVVQSLPATLPSAICEFLRSYEYAVQGEHRTSLADKLRCEYASKGISAADVAAMAGCLWRLGDADPDSFVAGWLGRTDEWKSWPASDYLYVAQRLSGDTAAATEVCRRLADQLASRHLAGEARTEHAIRTLWVAPSVASKSQTADRAARRLGEPMGRGVVALPAGGPVYVSWRLLQSDPLQAAFDVHRASGAGGPVKLNAKPIRRTTDFTDATAEKGVTYSYFVTRAGVAPEEGKDEPATIATPSIRRSFLPLPLQGNYTAMNVGIADLDGDGKYDFVIKQPLANRNPTPSRGFSPGTYKVEAYKHDGKFLWRFDLGWSIEQGIFFSPYVVYDLDGDGKAEVALKTAEGDHRGPDGRVRTGPEYLSILDGLTGRPIARVDWPPRKPMGYHSYNNVHRNHLDVAYLDGKTPYLIVRRGTYGMIVVVAYQFRNGELEEFWTWRSDEWHAKYWGSGAHTIRVADVDSDGKDEVIIGAAVIDDDGTALWSTGLGHPDNCYVGDLDPTRPGLEVFCGYEWPLERNGMCMVDAATGKILWGWPGPTKHIHGRGLVSDLDPRYPGSECFGIEQKGDRYWLFDCKGNVLTRKRSFGPHAAYWDADPQRGLVNGSYSDAQTGPKVEGLIVAIADVIGDWREEIITSLAGEIRIYSTNVPAQDRRVCLMQDPIYRLDVAAMSSGYWQVPMLTYDMATQAGQFPPASSTAPAGP